MQRSTRPEEYSEALAAEIRRLREEAGLSQNKLAAAAGISRTMLTYIERGLRIPTVEMLFRIAGGITKSPSDILRKVEKVLAEREKQKVKPK